MTKAYPSSNRSVPSMKSWKRAEGPVRDQPSGPVWPACAKYGPIDRMTGTFSFRFSPSGSRTSACSRVPERSADGK